MEKPQYNAKNEIIKTRFLPFDRVIQNKKQSEWLGRKDSNPRMPGPKPGALPLGDSPMISGL